MQTEKTAKKEKENVVFTFLTALDLEKIFLLHLNSKWPRFAPRQQLAIPERIGHPYVV